MALWFFNKAVSFVLAAMLEGILLPSNMAAKTSFCLDLVKRLIVTLRCAVNVQKEVIHNFKNHILVTWPATNLLILRKWCRFEKPNHYYFVEDMTHLSFIYNFHFHKNDVTWILCANSQRDHELARIRQKVTKHLAQIYTVLHFVPPRNHCGS